VILLAFVLAVFFSGGVVLSVAWADGAHAKALKRAQGFSAAAKSERRSRQGQDIASTRRKQILTNLKAMERQQRKQSLTLENRLAQAGLAPNVRGFWIVSGVIAAIFFALGLVFGHNMLLALGLAFATGLGLPRWALGFLAKRRIKKFTSAFPDATDIIVRGIKSGLPVHDCLKVIATESPRPLNEEFQKVVENLGMGLSMDQCLEKMYSRMPTSEVRFFAIVLGIQAKTGGNLAEALNNLSQVLRARKLMKEKIKAMSGEAVASAGIIGSLPVCIMVLVGVTTPSYMAPLLFDPRGHVLLMIGGFWMACGVFVMRKMINFKF
jgi:tight adherence protein B